MKKLLSSASCLACIAVIGCQSAPADHYTVTGNIGGIADSTMIVLRNNEGGRGKSDRDTTYTKDGVFEFTGSIANPAFATIYIENPAGMGHAVEFMLENAPITIDAASLDSVLPSWFSDPESMMREKSVHIKGGKAQAEYQEYRDAIFPYELAVKNGHYQLYWAEDRKSRTPEKEAALKKAYNDADIQLAAAKDRFIDEHPQYNISQRLMIEKLRDPFSYTDEQLDGILAATEGSQWTARRDTLAGIIGRYRDVVSMSPYADIRMLDQKGDTVVLSDYVGKGNYVFIDFWASWCGPCRAAIPHVKELHAKYPEGLTILSVSIDKEKAEWERAVAEEKMTWTQLWAPGELSSAASEAYHFRSIPTLVIITPDGRIAIETSDANSISGYLERELTKSRSNQ